MSLLLALIQASILAAPAQASPVPAYVSAGDRVEGRFRAHREDLEGFYRELKDAVAAEAPSLLAGLIDDPPPEPAVFGYQILPEIVRSPPGLPPPASPVFRAYSWPLTASYIEAEQERLRQAWTSFDARARGLASLAELLSELVVEYGVLHANQKTIDQHVRYNRFWQRTVAGARDAFDRLDELYDQVSDQVSAGAPDTSRAVREGLSRPVVPSFVTLRREGDDVVVDLPVATDIDDAAYLARVESAAEQEWRFFDPDVRYRLDVSFRTVPAGELYAVDGPGPRAGELIDLPSHLDRFGGEAAVLTTGAESTHALVGRAVFLGAGALTGRTLAHEFGHLLGFRDGYLRGYEDLGEFGFEIREAVPDFDDIMAEPRSGRVSRTHFELLLAGVGID